MKEQKFKIFKKSINKFLDYTISPYNCICNSHNEDDLIFIEYIGLKDKNNKEIYEEDILYIHEHCKGEVIYHLDGFKIKTICSQSEILSRFYSWSNCEIIGNIHENPELLKV